jgi:hypothetical protein
MIRRGNANGPHQVNARFRRRSNPATNAWVHRIWAWLWTWMRETDLAAPIPVEWTPVLSHPDYLSLHVELQDAWYAEYTEIWRKLGSASIAPDAPDRREPRPTIFARRRDAR